MKDYDKLKQQWAGRPVPPRPEQGGQLILKQFKQLRTKHIIMQVVLGVTVLVLLFFFFYISAYQFTRVYLGLGIMMGALVIRILLEQSSMLRKNKLPIQEDMHTYNRKLEAYYHKRKQLHFLMTPLLFGGYIAGFVMLLPSFRASLSPGFYTYIVFSSLVVFVGLAVLIITQIRRELSILKSLQEALKQ